MDMDLSKKRRMRPAEQIQSDLDIRATHYHTIEFWKHPPGKFEQLTKVAIRILGPLTTSASVERASSIAVLSVGSTK
jgi:hypothetical protein